MDKEICPVNTFFRIYYKHFSEYILDKRVGFAGECQRFVLDFFEKVNDVIGSVRDSE